MKLKQTFRRALKFLKNSSLIMNIFEKHVFGELCDEKHTEISPLHLQGKNTLHRLITQFLFITLNYLIFRDSITPFFPLRKTL